MNPNDSPLNDLFEQILKEQAEKQASESQYSAPRSQGGAAVFAEIGTQGNVLNSSGVLIGSFQITGYAE